MMELGVKNTHRPSESKIYDLFLFPVKVFLLLMEPINCHFGFFFFLGYLESGMPRITKGKTGTLFYELE